MHAGTYRIDITPPIGYRLQGHAARTQPSTGVHDPLYASFLTLFDGHRRIALVTLDLIYLTGDFDQQVRQAVAEQVGIEPGDLLLACSHTHTGPFCLHDGEPKHYLPAYFEMLSLHIRSGIQLAMQNEQPVTLRHAGGDVNIGIVNRRRPTPQGVVMERHPDGPMDLTTPVMRLDNPQGEPVAIVYQYACHPTTLASDLTLISADYPGVARQRIEKAFPGAQAMHLTGCCGDVRPAIVGPQHSFGKGEFSDIERMGSLLADHVIACCQTATPSQSHQLAAARVEHLFEFDRELTPTSLEKLDQIVESLKQRDPLGHEQIAAWQQHWAHKLTSRGADAKPPAGVTGYLQAVKIGDVTLLALTGEVMSQFALSLREQLPEPLVIASYAQSAMGYIPTQQAMCEGGYETRSFLLRHWPPFSPSMPQALIAAAADLARSVQ